mmetsp:Transcript_144698/g.360681  ORF Transcript_144698/g.360681 Transcript_144698/m.360681 type:complete len:235 (-) Transcript_144698:10-714(-)
MARCARPSGLKHSSAVGVFSSSGVFGKMTTDLTPKATASPTSRRRPVSTPKREMPGIDEMGMSSCPSCTKTGMMKLAGVSVVSANISRMAGDRRFLRGRLRIGKGSTSGVPGGTLPALASTRLWCFRPRAAPAAARVAETRKAPDRTEPSGCTELLNDPAEALARTPGFVPRREVRGAAAKPRELPSATLPHMPSIPSATPPPRRVSPADIARSEGESQNRMGACAEWARAGRT